MFFTLAAGQSFGQTDAARETHEGVPHGTLKSGVFKDSKIFPGTERDYSVYVPAQYSADQPASLMVFMDGKNYANLDGAFRVPTVMDNLIHQQEMPVTIAVFVNPGTIPATQAKARSRSNRSFEYDSLGNRYVNFMLEEFLPVALEGLNVSNAPQDRAVCGISSGGIAAFTAAWERPDQFGKVMSHIGSYTNIRGGWEYPGLVRQTQRAPKPIKVYLQEGREDLNNLHGNWPLANQDLAAALQFAGYNYQLVMTAGGHSGQWGGKEFPDAMRWLWADAAESTLLPHNETRPEWEPHPDAVVSDDVPHGTVVEMPAWESKILENTIREWSVYVPAQYSAEQPAALMVFQDGQSFSNPTRRWRVPVVFDNLIARGDMPPTIAVFIDPGHDKSKPRPKNGKVSNRGLEYDSLGDRYARFLLEEILPEIGKNYNISSDPAMHAIGGSSSGGICAFTVAWEHSDAFQKVFSSVGSFTNLRGGNIYPALVRKTEPKPIRVYMADTGGDVDNAFGSWPWANQRMASALKYMGYDLRFDWAEGYAHNADFGGSRFPEAMKWLWRHETHRPVIDTQGDLKGDLTLLRLLIPGEEWQVVAENLGFADAPCADADGNFYFSDMRAPAVYRINVADGSRTELVAESVSGLEFGPDGLLYACQGAKQQVISIDPRSGHIDVVATGVIPNDLAVSSDGFVYITETKSQQITRINIASGAVDVVDTGIARPNGITLTNDQGTLAVSEYGGQHVWTFRVNEGGVLDAKMPTMTLRRPIDPEGKFDFNQPPPYQAVARGDGMAVDQAGRYYVTSAVGVQIFDPTGRMCGVLPTPDTTQPLTSCVLAGDGHHYLYITNGQTIFKRKLQISESR
nr:alpha/beta hydrolase-fold protein [Aureliella helgolandensis]